jgi:hypothetical protein
MQHSFNGLRFVLGDETLLRGMPALKALPPFAPEVIAFLDAFSRMTLADSEAKTWPDVITLGFWCRGASMARMQTERAPAAHCYGRGVVFHIAPGNVAVNFAYSLIVGLITGNANIVRLPGRDYPQTAIIVRLIESVLECHPALRPRISLVRYGREQHINDALSALCDTRIIWGGDETIAQLRLSPLPPRGLDIAFADRYSIAMINADYYLAHPDKAQVARAFYNDTLLNDQNACSSPSLLVWMGHDVQRGREIFWQNFETLAAERYTLEPASAVNKLTQLCLLSARFEGVKKVSGTQNSVLRVELPALEEDTLNWRGNCGFFMEYMADSLDEITPVCGSRCQTLATFGIPPDALDVWLASAFRGIDRVVPFGRTLDFSLQWDGYDLVSMLTRVMTRASNSSL